jgi:hypothetical protein
VKSRLFHVLAMIAIASSTLIGMSGDVGAVPVPWKNCGKAGDTISVSKFDASVWPPQAGNPITLSLQYTVGRDINAGGYQLVTLTRPSGRTLTRTIPIVEVIKAGPSNTTVTLPIPPWIPPGAYAMHIETYHADASPALCVDLTLPIKG